MDQQDRSQPTVIGIIGGVPQLSYAPNPYARIFPSQGLLMTSVAVGQGNGQAVGVQLGGQHHVNQQQQSELDHQLHSFWANQYQGIERLDDFRSHSLPYARIKKIMKADEDVKMVSAEAPILFAKACEMFISELTLRAWHHTEGTNRRMIQKNDVAAAIARADTFDFLADVVKDEAPQSVPRHAVPMGESSGSLAHHNVQPLQVALAGDLAPGLAMNRPMLDSTLYAQQPHPYTAPYLWSEAPAPQQPQPLQMAPATALAPGLAMDRPVIDPTLYAQRPYPCMAPHLWSEAPTPQQSQPLQMAPAMVPAPRLIMAPVPGLAMDRPSIYPTLYAQQPYPYMASHLWLEAPASQQPPPLQMAPATAPAPGLAMDRSVIDPTMYAQQPYPYMTPHLWLETPTSPQAQPPSDS